MNKDKIAFYEEPDSEKHFAGGMETIREMFNKTDENGILYIPEWNYEDEPEPTNRYYKCTMDWKEADVAEAEESFNKLYNCLEQIVARSESHNGRIFVDSDSLPQDLKDVWNTYFKRFREGYDPDLGYYTSEESREWNKIVFKEAKKRMGDNPAAYAMIIWARRLAEFMKLRVRNIPQVFIDINACYLTQAMVIHTYCKSIEIVTDVE